MRLGRFGRVTAAAGVVTLALLLAMGSPAATRSARSIVGTYQIVTHLNRGIDKGTTTHGTIQIKTYNRHTRKFAGSGTEEFSSALFKITGNVDGPKFRMTVSGGGVTAHDRGTVKADGSIRGTLTDGQGDRGRWTMTPLSVVVTKAGWGVDRTGGYSSFYGVGLKLVNRSKRDAINVTVTLQEQGSANGNLSGEQFKLAFIPPKTSFVIGDAHGNIGSTRFTHIGATIHVGAMIPHDTADRLLRVSDVRLDRKNYAVDAVVTNPEPTALNIEMGTAYTVLYNAAGRIIGGGNVPLWPGYGPGTLKAGGHEPVSIEADGNWSRVTHVQVSATAFP